MLFHLSPFRFRVELLLSEFLSHVQHQTATVQIVEPLTFPSLFLFPFEVMKLGD